MAKYGFLEETSKDSLQKLPLGLNYSPESHREGIATYFRAYLVKGELSHNDVALWWNHISQSII